jgi:hypothetical protein
MPLCLVNENLLIKVSYLAKTCFNPVTEIQNFFSIIGLKQKIITLLMYQRTQNNNAKKNYYNLFFFAIKYTIKVYKEKSPANKRGSE